MWECSHLGGDRFAANVLVLPHGFYYGQVPGDGAELVAAHERGQVALPWLRGRAGVPPAGQAAQQHARAELGLLGVDDLPVTDVRALTGPGAEIERWTVTMAGPARGRRRHRGEPPVRRGREPHLPGDASRALADLARRGTARRAGHRRENR